MRCQVRYGRKQFEVRLTDTVGQRIPLRTHRDGIWNLKLDVLVPLETFVTLGHVVPEGYRVVAPAVEGRLIRSDVLPQWVEHVVVDHQHVLVGDRQRFIFTQWTEHAIDTTEIRFQCVSVHHCTTRVTQGRIQRFDVFDEQASAFGIEHTILRARTYNSAVVPHVVIDRVERQDQLAHRGHTGRQQLGLLP
ncbi:hypothetical protein D3C85_579990 [compost metagenome]